MFYEVRIEEKVERYETYAVESSLVLNEESHREQWVLDTHMLDWTEHIVCWVWLAETQFLTR